MALCVSADGRGTVTVWRGTVTVPPEGLSFPFGDVFGVCSARDGPRASKARPNRYMRTLVQKIYLKNVTEAARL